MIEVNQEAEERTYCLPTSIPHSRGGRGKGGGGNKKEVYRSEFTRHMVRRGKACQDVQEHNPPSLPLIIY